MHFRLCAIRNQKVLEDMTLPRPGELWLSDIGPKVRACRAAAKVLGMRISLVTVASKLRELPGPRLSLQ